MVVQTTPLERFHTLDRTFGGELDSLLHDETYIGQLMGLQGNELIQVLDYLSDTTRRLIRAGGSPRKCLDVLRKISRTRKVVPSTYEVSGTLLALPNSSIAYGGSGNFLRGNLTRKEDVCIKKLRLYANDNREKINEVFRKGAIVWKHLDHPNIVPFKGVTLDPPQLVSEWMPGGELREYIKKNPSTNLINLLLGVAGGLAYLHSHDIIHGDLKGSNIFVDGSGNARITDFGLTNIIRDPSSAASSSDEYGFTPRWTAPEIFRGEATANKKSDIFSFGMVAFEAFSGTVPFPEIRSPAVPVAIMKGNRPNRPVHPGLTEPLWRLVQECWKDTAGDRPEIADVIKELKRTERIPPTKKTSEDSRVAIQGRSTKGAPGKQPIPEPPKPNVGEREVTPYDVDAPLPASTSYLWQDLLNSPMNFDAVLSGVLQSTTEVERIKGLTEVELQRVIDVLGQYLETRDAMNGIGKECFQFLCEICATGGLLPTLYTLNPSDLRRPEEAGYIGGFGTVWKGKHNGSAVAIKRLNVAHLTKSKKIFCHEVIMWKRLSHPNTLPFIGACIRGSELVVVSEWIENGNIREYLRRNTQADRLSLLVDVARGVEYLHDMHVVHGDLKGTNILVKDDGSACLADFGLISITLDLETTDIASTSGGKAEGTYRWMSPELFDPKNFGLPKVTLTKMSDCYALGMVIYEVLSGKDPFEELGPSVVVPCKVLEGTHPGIPKNIDTRMMGLWDLARECWSHRPQDRPSSTTILDRLNAFARTSPGNEWVPEGGQPTQGSTNSLPSVTSSNASVTHHVTAVHSRRAGFGRALRAISAAIRFCLC